MKTISLSLFAVLLFCSFDAFAQEVRPEQVAVIAAADHEESQQVAQYYCQQRGIDPGRVISVSFPEGDQLDRETWEKKVRLQIRTWLDENDPESEITCFVTTYGVPLSIGDWAATKEREQWNRFYDEALNVRFKAFNRLLARMADLANVDFQPLPAETPSPELGKEFDAIAQKCQQFVPSLPADQRANAGQRLQNSVRQIAGLGPFVNGIKAKIESSGENNQRFIAQYERALGINQGYTEALNRMGQMPPSFDREIGVLRVLEMSNGILGAIDWIRKQKAELEKETALSSFDSELALVRVEAYRRIGTYPLSDASLLNSITGSRVYRVTRIDGPNVEVAKSLIDRAIEASQGQLDSEQNIYIDQRGLPAKADPRDLAIENWLDRVAKSFASVEGVKVTRDEGPELFGSGVCPETKVYFGWYGLGEYRNSFTFASGSTCYHLVPGDALGIHIAEDTGWCKGFLSKGATWVVGSVSRPTVIDPGLAAMEGNRKPFYRPNRIGLSDGIVIFGDFVYEVGETQN